MATIEEIVRQLGDQAPVFEDPEDDAGDVTVARLASRHEDAEEVEALTVQSTQLRRRAAAYLESDQRYKGRKTSRKELYEFAEDDDDEEDDDGEEEFKGSASDSDPNEIGDNEDANDITNGYDENEEGVDLYESEEADVEEEMDSAEDVGDEEITSSGSDNEEYSFQDAEKDEGEKARAVVEQLDLWDCLMEGRIKLQKTLSLINKIPPGVQLEGCGVQQEAQSILGDLSCALCGLQSTKSSPRKRKADSDTDAEQIAKENFTSYQSVRNNTLTFWDDKTRLASKKFKSFNSFNTSVLKQVEQILSDRDRLVRRTRVSRDAEAAEVKPEEIFDDNDFYQRLLRQLVENKAEDACTSSSTHNQWLEIQKLRVKKKKKEVDTRASKGRKLRYNVHSKLVNFMAPRDDSTWSEEAKNELFKNLFKMAAPGDQ